MVNKPLHLTLLLIIIGNNLWAQQRNLIINEVCVANTDDELCTIFIII